MPTFDEYVTKFKQLWHEADRQGLAGLRVEYALGPIIAQAEVNAFEQGRRVGKAEGWEEGEADGQWNADHRAMIERGNREAFTNPYRNN